MRTSRFRGIRGKYGLLQKEVKHFASFKLSAEMQKDFDPMLKLSENMAEPLNKALALLRKHEEASDKQARAIIFESLVPQVNEFIDGVSKCTSLLDNQVSSEIVIGDQAAELGEHLVLGLSLIGGIVLLIYGFFTSKRLYSSLNEISGAIAETQDQVMSTSRGLASASHQASAGSTQAASALEETVASIEELTSMVKINADNSKSASSLSMASIQSAQEGEKEIRHLIDSMHEISSSSKKIEEIINVIDDIAFQTNLLALNASVEAARAGEHGRGFAVVAEAVRTLSQRSAAAAKDINLLIKESVDRVGKGSQIADRSEVLLQNILTSVKKVADLNNEIAAASSEQAEGISQITKAMNELDASVQQNAQASEEVAQSSEKMAHQASLLQGSISQLEVVLQGAAKIREESASVVPVLKNPVKKIQVAKPAQTPSEKPSSASAIIPFDGEDSEGRGAIGNVSGF